MRLIDADRLTLGFEVADKTMGLHGLMPFIKQGIEHAPTCNPWRKIDDIEGLSAGEQLIIIDERGIVSLGIVWNGKPFVPVRYLAKPKAPNTHYMQIPEVPE